MPWSGFGLMGMFQNDEIRMMKVKRMTKFQVSVFGKQGEAGSGTGVSPVRSWFQNLFYLA